MTITYSYFNIENHQYFDEIYLSILVHPKYKNHLKTRSKHVSHKASLNVHEIEV